MSKYTPGPWWAVDVSDGDSPVENFAVYSGQTTAVAQHITQNDSALIAAAPDLLAALELARAILFSTAGDDLHTHNAWNQAHEAISKAKGCTT